MFWALAGTFIYYLDPSSSDMNHKGLTDQPVKEVKEKKVTSYKIPILESSKVKGPLSKNQVQNELEKKSKEFKGCFGKNSPKKIKMDFEIDERGTVKKKPVKTKEQKCIVKILQEMDFPLSHNGGNTKVRQTFGDPTVENEGYSGLQNHFCKRRVMNWLIFSKIKIMESLDDFHYKTKLLSLDKIICEYSLEFPLKKNKIFILKTDEKLDPDKNCAYLPLARTWQVYDSNLSDETISLWVWKIAPSSFLVDQLYESPNFYKCNR